MTRLRIAFLALALSLLTSPLAAEDTEGEAPQLEESSVKLITSKVDQNCMQSHKEEHGILEITLKDLDQWLKDCRGELPKDKECKESAALPDATCDATVRNFYPYQFTLEQEKQYSKLCLDKKYLCQAKKEKGK